jgi:hypothetical protein
MILMPYKRETCGAWSENGLKSDECVNLRQRIEKNAKRVNFSDDRRELFQNTTIKAFAGNYLLSERFPGISLLENVRFSLF